MPIYEYRCLQCGKRINIFLRSFAAASENKPRCPHCQSENLRRLVSRVSVLQSEETRLDNLSDTGTLSDVDENDPRSVARWMRQMGNEAGEDLGTEFNEVVDRLEAGQSPEEIESDLPDMGLGDAGGPDLGAAGL